MTLPLEVFDLNQTGLLFLLVGALSVIREKRIIPYLMVVIGSLMHGWFCVMVLIGLLLIDRFHTQRSKWLLLLNAIGFAALIGAWVLSGAYQTVFLIYGLLAVSLHCRRGGMGVVVPLLMVHQFFPNNAPLEIVLPAAGLYLILEEVLRLAKSKQVESILPWAEVPLVLAILFPFKDDVLKLVESPEGLAALAGLLVVSIVVAAVLMVRKVSFQTWVQSGYRRGAKLYRALNRSFSERQSWIRESETVLKAADGDFTFFFWSAVSVLISWAVIIAVVQGRVG